MKKGIKNLYYNKKKLMALISCGVILFSSNVNSTLASEPISQNITIDSSQIIDNEMQYFIKVFMNEETSLKDVTNIVIVLPGSGEKKMVNNGVVKLEKLNIPLNTIVIDPIKKNLLESNDNRMNNEGILHEQKLLLVEEYLREQGNKNDFNVSLMGFSEGCMIIGGMLKNNPSLYQNIMFINGAPRHSRGKIAFLEDSDLENIKDKNITFIETINNTGDWNKVMIPIIQILNLNNNVKVLTNDMTFNDLEDIDVDFSLDKKYFRHGDGYKLIMELDLINEVLLQNVNNKRK